jgi:hypothetical protein
MPIANPVNPRKKFAWTIEFEGLEPVLAQRVKMPVLTVETAEHGVSNIKVKTGGMVTVGDIEVMKLMFMNKNENWAYDWMKLVSNPENGQVGVPATYKRNGYIIFYAPDMETILEKWQVFGCWPKEIDKDELDKVSSENIMEKVVLSCDYVLRTS